MTRISLILCVLMAPLQSVFAGGKTIEEARRQLLTGKYSQSQAIYEELQKKPKDFVDATIGVTRCLRQTGKYDQAMGELTKALKKSPKSADLLAEKADLEYFRGKWDNARWSAIDALDINEEQFLAHWVLARLYSDQGKLFTSNRELLWFIRIYGKRANQGKEIVDPEKLMLVGLAAVERARRDARLLDQFQFVLQDVWAYSLKKEEDFWWAHYQRGEIFQEKYDQAQAFKEFNKALVINPNAAQVYVSKGVSALRRFRIEDAELYVKQALNINPNLPAALRLKADVYLTAGDTDKAMNYLEKAEKVNPRSEATLARIAFCHYLDKEQTRFDEVVAAVEKQNPKAGEFYYQLGAQLDKAKRYGDAEKFLKRSLKLLPTLTKAQHDLGLLHMRLGEEARAKEILTESFKADPFHVRVFNTLQVLDHLSKYDVLNTEHFTIKYDKSNDGVLARVMAKYLEDIYAELSAKFNYEPKERILIEILNEHEMFSGRVIALPDLHTIGACTGRMIAMVSPNDKSGVITKPFNWNRVLRHELVHVFNLEQTHFLVPHWVTEGLAVQAEELPMPTVWYGILRKRVQNDDLMNLDNIHLGFIRPGNSENWHLAYLQSKLYIDYLVENHGKEAIGQLLNAYRDGVATSSAIEKVCGISKAEFERGYREYLEALVESFAGKASKKPLGFSELKEQLAKKPNDPNIAAALAGKYFLIGNKDRANELADKALKIQNDHPQGSYVKARLSLASGNQAKAKEVLKKALGAKPVFTNAMKLYGKLEFDAKNFTEAARSFELGHKAEPYDSYWLAQMIRCYKQNGDDDKLYRALKKYAPTEADDIVSRRALAVMSAKAGNHADAEKYARQALEIDVNDPDSQKVLFDALQAQGKEKEHQQWKELLTIE